MAQTVLFELVKDTKNTRKYAEVPDAGQPPKIGTLYVQKWWANGAQRLRVTVEPSPAIPFEEADDGRSDAT